MTNNNSPQAIYGIGSDIVEIERIKKAIERQGQPFLDKIFSPKELEYCKKFKEPFSHFAGKFAAKEAIVKSFQTGFNSSVLWSDIEVLNDPKSGAPYVKLSDKLIEKYGKEASVMITISHSKDNAVAFALFLKND
jgi:holo-[acyl-carrier protein] synthase